MQKKTIAALITAVILVAGGIFAVSRMAKHGNEDGNAGVPVISVSTLSGADAVASNRFTGMVETQKKKNITLDSDKTVKKVLVTEGSKVKEGDPLFTYDTEKTELEISKKELEKEKLKLSIENLKEQIEQLQKQLNEGNLTSTDRMTMNAQVLEHQTSVAQSEYDQKTLDSEIARMKASVKNSSVKSPITGTVEKIEDPATMTDPTAAFMTITADGDFRVKGKLSEQSIGIIYEGLEMVIRSRVDDTQTWKGVVTAIETKEEKEEDAGIGGMPGGETASEYAFYVTLDSIDGLMLGQHVTLEPDFGETMEGLVLPVGYISYGEDGNAYVYAVSKPGDKLEKRSVELGEMYEEQGMVQILSGLTESEYVAWPDNEDCVEGAATKAGAFMTSDSDANTGTNADTGADTDANADTAAE